MLIPNWKKAYKMLSVQAITVVGLIAAAEPFLPQIAQFLPANWVAYAMPIILLARVVKQNNLGVEHE